MTSRIRVEGRRHDELTAEPAGRPRPRRHDPPRLDGNRRAHCRGAAGQPAIRSALAHANASPDGNSGSTPVADPFAFDADAYGPTGAADTHSRTRGRYRG